MKTVALLSLALAFLGLVGCSTVHSRIEEKAAVFNSLDPQTQARIRQGLVDIGYTEDMVYIAMGRPDETKEHMTAKGRETTWIYNSYWQEYEGSRLVGFHRVIYFDKVARAYRVFYEPVRAEMYSDRVEERTRVMFKDGKVTAIEQAKN
ncbi:hypothetical protein DB347_03410 [Opitutaceae bacterium EW11]|nr:hypothetical protein DB347_03410 [Opitutaceae bacterium EW11]